MNNDRTTARCHVVSRLDLWKYYSLRWYVEFVLQSRTRSVCSRSSMEYSEKEPALQCRRQSARRTIIIEAWFRGYSGSPGLGGPRTAGLCTCAGQLDYEDTRLKTSSRVRVGLSFAWKAILAIRICRFPSLVPFGVYTNRLCVTLAPFGVYTNRRV